MKKLILSLLNNRIVIALIWIVIIFVFVAYNYFDISLMRHFGICNFYAVTGLLCPGCGGTRAVHFLLRGNIAKSLSYHIVPFILLVYLLLLFGEHSISVFMGKKARLFIPRVWMLWPLGTTIILYAIVRNLF